MTVADGVASAEWPFIGLRPFDYPDKAFFFGRTESVGAIEKLVVASGFVAIVGSSGAGKSSLVRAGLLPCIEARAGELWRWKTMEPGEAPIERLARAISKLRDSCDEMSDAWEERIAVCLRRSQFGIPEAISLFPAAERNQNFVIIVDQFEELFRFANLRTDAQNVSAAASLHRDEATAFVRLLLAAGSIDSIRVHIVITMRSDFIGDCAHFHELPEAVTRCQFLAPGLTRDQRAVAMTGPLSKASAELDPQLVQRVLNDTNEDPDQLPVIQHAMMRCWQRASARAAGGPIRIETEDYLKIGGVADALSLHADRIFEEFSCDDAKLRPKVSHELVAKRVFQALTDVDQNGRVVRRPMRFGDLAAYVSSSDWSKDQVRATTLSVVRRLANPDCSFLRFATDETVDDDTIVDIGHEALIRRWSKLKGGGETDWIREEQDGGDKYRDLVRRVRGGGVVAGAELKSYEDWWASRKPTAAWAKRYAKDGKDYLIEVADALGRSREEYDRNEQTKIRAAEAEKAELALAAERAKTDAEAARASAAEQEAKAAAAETTIHRQNIRTFRYAAAASVGFIAIAGWLGFRSYSFSSEVAAQREEQQSLLTQAAQAILTAPRLVGAADAVNLLVSAPDAKWTHDYFNAVYDTLASLREVRRMETLGASSINDGPTPVLSVSFNPAQPLLAAVTPNPPRIHILKYGDGGKTVSWIDDIPIDLKGLGWVVARWNPDGDRIYVGAGARGVIITPCSSKALRSYFARCAGKTEDETIELSGSPEVGFGYWSANGKDIVTGSFQGQPHVWNAETGKIDEAFVKVIDAAEKPDAPLTSLAINASGDTIAEGNSNGAISLVHVGSSESELSLSPKVPSAGPTQLLFNPKVDGQLLALYQTNVALWRTNAIASESQSLDNHHSMVLQAVFDPSGQFIATGANDGTVRLFALKDGKASGPVELRGHKRAVFAVDVAKDGTIASGSGDGTLRFWRVEPALSPETRSYEPADVERLKGIARDNLPYLNYGADRIPLPSDILCAWERNCTTANAQ
jgi:WD40 repeat protein